MATNFPSSQDNFTNPTDSDTLDSPNHAGQHADVNDAVEAIEGALLDGAPLHIDDANERVGIGTASPSEELHIAKDQDGDLTQVLIENLDQRVRVGSYYEAGVAQYGKIQSEQDGGGDIALALNPEGGNVGIGTTSPATALEVAGAAAHIRITDSDTSGTTGIDFYDSNGTADVELEVGNSTQYFAIKTAGSEAMRIDSSGRVGVGTTSPDAPLDISGSSSTQFIGQRIINTNTTAGAEAVLKFEVLDQEGRIGLERPEPDVGADMYFSTTDAGASSPFTPTERMRITQDGNVGVGTAAPSTLLHLSSGTSGDAELRIAADTDNSDENDLPYLSFAADGGILEGVVGLNNNSMVFASSCASAQGFDFRTGTTNYYTNGADVVANTTSRMFIDVNGNVGINQTSPSYDLDVVGRGRFAEGNNSYIFFGPNNTWGGNLYVGSTDNKSTTATAQVIATDGNLHLDSGAGKDVYVNYYQTGNTIRLYGNTIVYNSLTVQDGISLRSANGAHDSITRVGGIYFTWDSDTYGTNDQHSIRSTDGDSWSDDITINSFGNVRVNIDTNGNGTNYFTVGRHTTGVGNILLAVDESGRLEMAGCVQANTGMTVGALRAANSINGTYADNSSIQFATDTYWGGVHDQHTGFLMWCGGMNGWNTAQLGFRVGSGWATYNASNPLRLYGTRTYINLGGESTYNVYADGAGRIGYYSSRRDLKNHVADIAPEDALARIMQLQPIDFTWKKEHRPEDDLANELIDFDVHRGFYAEDAAAVDVTYGTYGWVANEQDAEDGEVSHLQPITESLEHYEKTLEDAVVVSYDDKAILADLVGSVKALESRIAQLETIS